jgi:transcriptional regulator with XRE-family HTH domain
VCHSDTPREGTFGRRLQEAAKARGIATPNKLAGRLRVAPSGPTGWWGGKLPSSTNLLKLARLLGVNAHWLLTGEGAANPPGVAERAYAEMVRMVGSPEDYLSLVERARAQWPSPLEDGDDPPG